MIVETHHKYTSSIAPAAYVRSPSGNSAIEFASTVPHKSAELTHRTGSTTFPVAVAAQRDGWYVGRLPRLKCSFVKRARHETGSALSVPISRPMAVRANNSQQTILLTGFPGKPN